MSISNIISIIGVVLITLVFYTYIIHIRSYSSGFKEGLEIGKKIGKIDAQIESEE